MNLNGYKKIQMSKLNRKRYFLEMTFEFYHHNSKFLEKLENIKLDITLAEKTSFLFSGFSWLNYKSGKENELIGIEPQTGSIKHMLWRRDGGFYNNCLNEGIISSKDMHIYSDNIDKDISDFLKTIYNNDTKITIDDLEFRVFYSEQIDTTFIKSIEITNNFDDFLNDLINGVEVKNEN